MTVYIYIIVFAVEAVPISVEGPSSSFSEVLLSSPSNSATGPATPAGAAGDLEFNPPDRWGQACDDLDAGHDVHDMVEHAFKTIYTDSFSHVGFKSKRNPLVGGPLRR